MRLHTLHHFSFLRQVFFHSWFVLNHGCFIRKCDWPACAHQWVYFDLLVDKIVITVSQKGMHHSLNWIVNGRDENFSHFKTCLGGPKALTSQIIDFKLVVRPIICLASKYQNSWTAKIECHSIMNFLLKSKEWHRPFIKFNSVSFYGIHWPGHGVRSPKYKKTPIECHNRCSISFLLHGCDGPPNIFLDTVSFTLMQII